jgi:IS605 OrfB family transposase
LVVAGFVGALWDGRAVAVERLREWRGVKPVAGPAGVAITTRLRTTAEDEFVLDAVADHVGRLRRADLASACRPQPLAPGLDTNARRRVRRERLNNRKGRLTAQSSARWANAIIGANDAQYRLSRDAQYRHIIGLRAAIATIEKRLSAPTADTPTAQERRARRGQVKGYPIQAERFQKQRRVQHLRAELARAEADRANRRVRVSDGTKRLAKARHNLDAAGLTLAQWQQNWKCARYRITANGSGDEPFGNLTLTVTPNGHVSLRLPKPLECLANAKHGRYVLSGTATFCHRADEWAARITGGQSVSYTITRKPGRAGRYLTAAWATKPRACAVVIGSPDTDVFAAGPVVGVDLNDGHLAVRRLDEHGNPVGKPARLDIDLSGRSDRRDAQVRHAITRLIRYTRQHGIDTIAVEDLDFADARTVGRETMGRGQRGKRFRKTVSEIPTAVFRNRLTAQTAAAGIGLLAVNPAYSSAWGRAALAQTLLKRHPAPGSSHGDRASRPRPQGTAPRRCDTHATRGSRRESYRPDRAPRQPARTDSRRQPGMRGTKSRPPGRTSTRLPGRATVTPAPANNGQQHQ